MDPADESYLNSE